MAMTPYQTKPQPWMEMIGTHAPEWSDLEWINSKPLSLEGLKGKVILVRWWLETCPYCEATAPSLNEFDAAYSDKGLVVIGMYHPKPMGRRVSIDQVTEFSEAKNFKFPIAIDENWENLNNYWFEKGGNGFTSVSFILDRDGVIRYIHPGGSYNPDGLPHNDPRWSNDYFEVKAVVEGLVDDP